MDKKGGGKMVQILATLFKRVEEENKIPIQWREKYVYKEKTKKGYKKFKEGCF